MKRLRFLWRNLVRRHHVEDDLEEELRETFRLLVDEHVAAGMSAEAARRAARLELGAIDALKDRVRDVRTGRAFETVWQDVRFAVRSLRRTPGFTAVALLTLALCTGANAAVFCIVDGVLLRPLPYRNPDRLVRLRQTSPRQVSGQGPFEGAVSYPDLQDWREQSNAFDAMAGMLASPQTLTGRGEPLEVQAAYVTDDFFRVFAVPPSIGRALLRDDAREAAHNVVISDRLWRRVLGGHVDAVGQAILLRGQPYTIAGVMPPPFRYPSADTDIWIPEAVLTDDSVGPRVRTNRIFTTVARLRDGATLAQARGDLAAVASRLAREYPDTNGEWSATSVVPLQSDLVGSVDRTLTIVLAAVAFVLLIGCANVSNLLLARSVGRAQEVAIRMAIGAGRVRLVRQFLTESLVLTVAGGALGLVLASWSVPIILASSAGSLPRVEDVHLDARVFGALAGVVVVTAFLCGILPAWRTARTIPDSQLRNRSAAAGDRRARNGLVAMEVGTAVLLLIAASLTVRSLLALQKIDPGFEPDHVLAVTVQWNLAGLTSDRLGDHLTRRREDLIERVRALPGVVDAGTITSLPLQGQCTDFVQFQSVDPAGAPGASFERVNNCLVSRTYLETMRIRLLRGTPLPESLPPLGGQLPLLVNETAARRLWPNQDPVGRRVRFPPQVPFREGIVVGLVADVHQLGLALDPPPLVYSDQRLGPRLMTTLVVRTSGDPALLAEPIRASIRGLDPNQPIRRMETLRGVMAESLARDRFFTMFFAAFGGLALLLAVVGVYGVIAYTVGQRTREIGIRMALGARRFDVLRNVVGGGMRPIVVGILAGLVLSLALSRVLANQLYGVSATDPAALTVAVIVLAAAAFIACTVPAVRATRVDPALALRDK